MAKPNPNGSTFAERAAAAAGKDSFTAPTPEVVKAEENSTFAGRAKGAKADRKAVDEAENKAVKSSSAKSRKS